MQRIGLDTNCLIISLSNDHNFYILKDIDFPQVEVIDIDAFRELLEK